MNPFNWTCPHCDRPQTVVETHIDVSHNHLYVGDTLDGPVGYTTFAICCVNPECCKLSFSITVRPDKYWNPGGWKPDDTKAELFSERLMPSGSSKPQPDYIPPAIRQDYHEACLIRDLSPKASATLARRCIQGMIRDFCSISKARLIDEVRALRAAVENGSAPRSVSLESVDAIDHVREIGNIGAHMERDIDVIIDVDPGEAGVLIELIEMLLRDWYVDRHLREERFSRLATIGADKKIQKSVSDSGQ